MANYNHGLYLEERISSILEQLGPEDEFVIVDDASTDNSPEIIQKFQDKRILFLRNEINSGVIKTAARATKTCQGKFLIQLAADDKIEPGFLQMALEAFEAHPHMALFCSDYTTFSQDDGPYTTYRILPGEKEFCLLTPQKTLSLFRKTTFRIAGHTVVVKRAIYDKYGGLDENLGPYCDWFLWHTIALHELIGYAPKVGCFVRMSGSNFSKKPGIELIHQALLLKLDQKEMLALKKLFCQSTLLYPFVRKNLSWVLNRPSLWKLFAYTIFKNTLKRWQRSLKKRTSASLLKEKI